MREYVVENEFVKAVRKAGGFGPRQYCSAARGKTCWDDVTAGNAKGSFH